MIDVRTIFLPSLLLPGDVEDRVVVVFDVIRATTTITTALENGANEVRVFGSLEEARSAAAMFTGPKLLAGEQRCLRPEGFDLGNSPAHFSREKVGGKTLFFSTTNGTRALVAASKAKRLFAGSIRNAMAVANVLNELQLPVTLLCAGTEGRVSLEDSIGCGAVRFAFHLLETLSMECDSALIAETMFLRVKDSLDEEFALGKAADNLRRAGLESDLAFCAELDASTCVPECNPATMTLRPFAGL